MRKIKIVPKTYNPPVSKKSKKNSFPLDLDSPFSNVQAINARLYKLMFDAYYRVSDLKNILDTFISQGKKYYKDYEITATICYDAPEDQKFKLANGEDFEFAECDWELSTTYGKKMPSKMKALDLWNNYQFAFPEGIGFYFCRPMFNFVFSEKPNDEGFHTTWHTLPDEVITKLNPNDFYMHISVEIGKKTLPKNITCKDRNSLEDGRCHSYELHEKETNPILKYLKKRYLYGPFLFGKTRELHFAKTLLKLELEEESLVRKIEQDFAELKRQGCGVFKELETVGSTLVYNHHHLPRHFLGIKTQKEKIIEILIEETISQSLDVEDFKSNEKLVFNWIECYAVPPFTDHYLCYSFHQLWDHCNLSKRQFINLRPRNFHVGATLYFDFEDEEA